MGCYKVPMTRLLRSRSVVAAVVAALGILLVVGWLSVGRAAPVPELPDVGAEELIATALQAIEERTPVSGTVKTHVDLGLPQLPSGLGDPAGPAGVLLADQTFKYWRSPDGVRVAQIVPFAERDVVANETDAWFWDSEKYEAWHVAMGEPMLAHEWPPPSLGDLEAVVGRALREVWPYAVVSVVDPQVVAGRDAHVVRLAPASSETLVGRIEVAVDAQTRLPLRLQMFAKGRPTAVLEAGFASVDFEPVDASMFEFAPPENAMVTEVTAGHRGGGAYDGAPHDIPQVRTFGAGFGLIVAVRVAEVPRDLRPLFPYAGPLASADLVDRGDHTWVVVGLVTSATLAGVEPELP